tara:strand:+ start:627694 stop:628398 length:705 start_codon:yes stop_codon:yes gene_type:complete
MEIQKLFETGEISPKLAEWLNQFDTCVEALNNLPKLFETLGEPEILGNVHPSAVIDGPVWIGKGAEIGPCAVLQGPVFIGEGAEIGSHAVVRKQAYVSKNCVIGHGADIKHSICLDGSKIQASSFAGDSVLGVAARVASGAILSNRKFNQTEVYYKNAEGKALPTGRGHCGAFMGRHSRVGANCVISPGTVIGQHTWIGSGVVLSGTHGDNEFIMVKQELEKLPKDEVVLRHDG